MRMVDEHRPTPPRPGPMPPAQIARNVPWGHRGWVDYDRVGWGRRERDRRW
ncbi:MAG TPA: hypothetical protein VEA69_17240 [Tepidisphaeraceae bacterium]|nr:hypothetical protein [Tepidisphaeraceae bacterium]